MSERPTSDLTNRCLTSMGRLPGVNKVSCPQVSVQLFPEQYPVPTSYIPPADGQSIGRRTPQNTPPWTEESWFREWARQGTRRPENRDGNYGYLNGRVGEMLWMDNAMGNGVGTFGIICMQTGLPGGGFDQFTSSLFTVGVGAGRNRPDVSPASNAPVPRGRPSNAPYSVTPGIRLLEGYHVSPGKAPRVQTWRAHYGRLVGRTDFNADNQAECHAETHYHRFEYDYYFKHPIEVDSHVPGEFPNGR